MSTQLDQIRRSTMGDPATHPFRMLIGGALADGARQLDVVNPATETPVAAGPIADQNQVSAAIAAAKQAFPGWSALPVADRATVLTAMARMDRVVLRIERKLR